MLSNLRKVYLAHPYAKREEGRAIQARIEALGIAVTNPFERGEQAIYDKKIGPGSDSTGLDTQDCEDIVEMDLRKIDESDGVVAYLPDATPSIGTFMEIFYTAHVARKPVVALAPADLQSGHPWIRYYTKVVRSVEEMEAALGG